MNISRKIIRIYIIKSTKLLAFCFELIVKNIQLRKNGINVDEFLRDKVLMLALSTVMLSGIVFCIFAEIVKE